jgi:hypothetical protein
MDKIQMLELYDQDQRIAVEYPRMRREVTPQVVRHVDTSGAREGALIYSRLDESSAEAVIAEQVAYFEAIGQDFEWKLFEHDRPADLKDRLARFGFIVEEAEAIMALDLEQAPEVLWQPVEHPVEQIRDPEMVGVVIDIEQQVWDEDFSMLKRHLEDSLRNEPGEMSVYLASVDGLPVSAAWIYFPKHSQFASLWGGSTLSGYRKRGLYTAVLAARAQEARRRQVRFLTVDASPMSEPILAKFGFVRLDLSYPCKWKRGT